MLFRSGYSAEDILAKFQKLYPSEWRKLCERFKVYSEKDSFLSSIGKKKRYCPKKPEQFFYSLQKVKYLLSKGYRLKHAKQYAEGTIQKYCVEFETNRLNKIRKQELDIEKKTRKLQRVDPGFLDALIFAYHRKGNSTNDKLEIFKEIQKYDCEKAWKFFWKLNDSERNDEIRNRSYNGPKNLDQYFIF